MLITLFKQPKAVFLLAFVQLWNRFSHYGMRALLLLYMVKILKFSDSAAIGIFAVYCALVELGGVYGAYLAEKFLGLRRAVMWGGWLIGIGHLLLALELNFFVALAFVILGSSLYTTNIATLLGDFYPSGDKRREEGFTLFYMSINIGAFLATLLCGYIAENFGWHLGFGLAAIGMVIANLTLWKLRSYLKGNVELPMDRLRQILLVPLLALGLGLGIAALQLQHIASPLLPWIACALLVGILARLIMKQQIDRLVIRSLIISLGSLVLFFAAEEQIGSTLLLFADRMGNKSISAMSLLAINPLVIIAGGSLAHTILSKLKSPPLRIFLPFVLISGAFGTIALGAGFFNEAGTFPLVLIGGVIGVISFAELLVGPAAYSACSEASSTYKDPKVMALMPIGFALAASLGGVYSKALAAESFDPERYGIGFGILAVGLLGFGALLSYLKRQRSSFSEAKESVKD